MSRILSTLVFATVATAQVTTSIWMPSPYQDTHIGFLASVVDVNEGKTTLALHFDNKTDLKTAGYMINHKPNTMTFHAGGFEAVSTESAYYDVSESTVTYGCELESAKTASADGVCSFVSDGPGLYKSACSSYSDYTDVVTRTHERTIEEPYLTVITETTVVDFRTMVPDYCKSGSVLPESARAHTYAIEEEDIATYQVVITAGTEKLQPTAGATPSNSAPAPTGTAAAFTLHRGQNVKPTGTEEAPVQHTGAASAVSPLHPALAGLGAAALAFLL